MFKMIIRVALAFAVVWMLVPHGAGTGAARPGLPAVAHYFGWSHTHADGERQAVRAAVPRLSADCTPAAGAKGKTYRLSPPPGCPDAKGRSSAQ